MATRVIDDTKLQNIAVAIQSKDNGGQMTVDEMPTRIENIPTGGATLIPKTITENGVYKATDDNADGYDIVTVDVPEKNTLDEYFADTLEVANIPSATSFLVYMFQNKKKLRNVIMPNITSINGLCFSGCTSLALTSLPDGVTDIYNYAFDGCINLALTTLPRNLTNVGIYAFRNCKNLALTSLPNTLTKIPTGMFHSCTNLALTSLPRGIVEIGGVAFYNCTGIPFLDFSDFTQIPTIAANAFSDTTFPFYFRDQQQLDEWAAATNWSNLTSRFQIKPSGVI